MKITGVIIFIAGGIYCLSCSQEKKTGADERAEKMVSDIAVGPSTFYCSARVMMIDTAGAWLLVKVMKQQGSALFYPVAAGDTIYGKFVLPVSALLRHDSLVNIYLEEKLKINSDKPDFIIRQISAAGK
jgi:hypothetical protein